MGDVSDIKLIRTDNWFAGFALSYHGFLHSFAYVPLLTKNATPFRHPALKPNENFFLKLTSPH